MPLKGTNPLPEGEEEQDDSSVQLDDDETDDMRKPQSQISAKKKKLRRSRTRSRSRSRSKSKAKSSRRSRTRSRSRSRDRDRRRSRSESRDRHKRRRSRSRSKSRDRKSKRDKDRDSRRRSRSRSRSRDRGRKRRRSRSSSFSLSPSPERKDRQFLDYLDAEDRMLEQLEAEQMPYLQDSQKHPDYAGMWEDFFSRKRAERERRGRPPPSMQEITPEWIDVWKEHFFRLCAQRKREATNKLMNTHKVMRSTLAEFERSHPEHMEKRGQRVPYRIRYRPDLPPPKQDPGPSGDRRSGGGRSRSPSVSKGRRGASSREKSMGAREESFEAVSPEPMDIKKPSPPEGGQSPSALSQISDSSLKEAAASPSAKKHPGSKSGSTAGSSIADGGRAASAPPEEATVIGTLRLLTALEHLLGDAALAGEIMAALSKANGMEAARAGKSNELVDDKDCFRYGF